MPITGLSLAVVGADYPNRRGPSRRFEIALCCPGEPIRLTPEPKNKADPNAVMVLSARSVHIGYVTAERAPWVKALLTHGRDLKAVFQEPTAYGALIRVSLDENDPDLPPERVRTNREPEFYPDDVYPDE